MGFGLSVGTPLPRRGILGRRSLSLTTVQERLAALCGVSDLAPFPWFQRDNDASRLYARLHPAEEDVSFWIEGDWLHCAAKTSSCGPGYHAHIVGLLESMGRELDLEWHWQNGDFGDETGYALHKNFTRLQDEMAALLQSIARILLERGSEGKNRLSLPIDFGPERDAFASSPLGDWPKDWFEKVRAAADADLKDLARLYYPWWDEGFTGDTWLKLAKVLLWMEFPWRSPLTDWERAIGELASDCVTKAEQAGYVSARADTCFWELSRIMNAGEEAIAPSPEGIGFMRGLMRRPLPGGWTLSVPGYFFEHIEDDGAAIQYWYNDFSVRGSSISFDRTGSPEFGALLKDKNCEFTSSGDGFMGGADIEQVRDEHGLYLQLSGTVEAENSVSVITASFNDDVARAVEIFRSVRPPKSQLWESAQT